LVNALVVEFPPLDPTEEAKMDPNFMMKVIGERAPPPVSFSAD